MAENIPPRVQAVNSDATRGLPYYEKLKRDLRETLHKKRMLDKNMAALEEQIFRVETTYLEDTGAGNIIKGFDNYIKGSLAASTIMSSTGGGTSTRRKGAIMEHDRVFSKSSASFTRDSSPQSSTHTTPSHAPTPTSSHAPASARESNHPTPTSALGMKASTSKKNKKNVEREDEDEGKPAKRLKISYARNERGND